MPATFFWERQFGERAFTLRRRMLDMARVVSGLRRVMAKIAQSPLILNFKSHGAVTRLSAAEPPQVRCRDGRWTLDPMNANYEKACLRSCTITT